MSDDCENCRVLEAKIAELETFLAPPDEEDVLAIRAAFGCERNAAALIFRLYEADGGMVTKRVLARGRPGIAKEKGPNDVDNSAVYVCRARRFMGKNSIYTVHGVGYGLTPEGISLVSQKLNEVPQS
jgi:DNA-binding response OmpR family regulator